MVQAVSPKGNKITVRKYLQFYAESFCLSKPVIIVYYFVIMYQKMMSSE